MLKKIFKRFLISIVSLVIVSIISFALMQLAPGGPMAVYAENPKITAADKERIKIQLGLDKPAYIRYFLWMERITLHGDLGSSYKTGRPVATEITERLPATLTLMLAAYLIAVGIAIPIGIYSATHRYSFADYLVTFGSFFGLSIPTFWFGLLLILVLALFLHIFPAGGYLTPWFSPSDYTLLVRPFAVFWEHFRYLIMPALVLGLASIASWSRYMRSQMLEVVNQDYIRTARAKGVPEKKVIYKHALRNALTPLITIMALDLPSLFGGAIVTESIFAWPGMGRLFINSVFSRDYQVLMGITMMTAVLVLIFNFIADILYAVLDPRVKYEG
ncbi:MAG TPA: ABC transporter permease [Bacillota bacterium]|nr:ABC transporter permease [Bacillota bacterium]